MSRLNRLITAWWFVPLTYLLLATLLVSPGLFGENCFLPTGLLHSVAPWTASPGPTATWNPLRWDGIGQFYPWRAFAARTLHAGIIPLWNPYQFCGTPFVANSQSAVFYPGNLLFWLLPTATAFGWSALLHLTLAGWFMYVFLRRIGVGRAGAYCGGLVYAFSAWQVNWLQLPTFLCTSCWIPLILRQIHILVTAPPGRGRTADMLGAAAAFGMLLLAGHLQIAFYGVLVAMAWLAALLVRQIRTRPLRSVLTSLGLISAAAALGAMLAAPALMPIFELSARSHRKGTASPAGYRAYTEYSLSPAELTALVLPGYFGGDTDSGNPFWGYYQKHIGEQSLAIRHNAAEIAIYVGVAPLLFILFALVRGLRRKRPDRRTLFFLLLAGLALLMALGTPFNALLYFGLPGFGQSGSPARALVIWSLAAAALCGLGVDRLVRTPPTRREALVSLAAFVVLVALCLNMASRAVLDAPSGMPAGFIPATPAEAYARVSGDWVRLLLCGGGASALLLMSTGGRRRCPGPYTGLPGASTLLLMSTGGRRRAACAFVAVLLIAADLLTSGFGVNPTGRLADVYPETEGIRYLKAHAGHERIMPVNTRWSLYGAPNVVMPPNAGMVYGLRDVQGYDSLLTGQYKAFADRCSAVGPDGRRQGSSPAEVGNMIFVEDPQAPDSRYAAAPLLVTKPPDRAQSARPEPVQFAAAGDMTISINGAAMPRARLVLPGGGLGPAPRWLQDDPTRVALQTDCPSPSRLDLSDQIYPGWRVTVDGRHASLMRQPGEPLFRAVEVPGGSHVVQFLYEPASYRVGLFSACLALCIGSSLLGACTLRK